MQKKKFNLERSKSRILIMQALYAWQVSGSEIAKVKKDILSEQQEDNVKLDLAYYDEAVDKITEQLTKLDEVTSEFINRKLTEIGPIEHAILRLGVYEILYRLDIPEKVTINESVELAKEYGATDSYKFINGVLDKVSKKYNKKFN